MEREREKREERRERREKTKKRLIKRERVSPSLHGLGREWWMTSASTWWTLCTASGRYDSSPPPPPLSLSYFPSTNLSNYLPISIFIFRLPKQESKFFSSLLPTLNHPILFPSFEYSRSCMHLLQYRQPLKFWTTHRKSHATESSCSLSLSLHVRSLFLNLFFSFLSSLSSLSLFFIILCHQF